MENIERKQTSATEIAELLAVFMRKIYLMVKLL